MLTSSEFRFVRCLPLKTLMTRSTAMSGQSVCSCRMSPWSVFNILVTFWTNPCRLRRSSGSGLSEFGPTGKETFNSLGEKNTTFSVKLFRCTCLRHLGKFPSITQLIATYLLCIYLRPSMDRLREKMVAVYPGGIHKQSEWEFRFPHVTEWFLWHWPISDVRVGAGKLHTVPSGPWICSRPA